MKTLPRFAVLGALCAMAASCGLPKDSEGTLDRVRESRQIRVGLILAGAPIDPRAGMLLARLRGATGAEPRLVPGDAEPLLSRLEEGELDLVVGRFTAASPWSTMVTLTPPLATTKQGESELILAAAMQNGENAWISLVEREARELPGVEQ
jgi:hypothetical protein